MSRIVLAVLLAAVVASGIAVVYERYRHRQLFVELTRAEHERDELNIEFGRLQLEQATLMLCASMVRLSGVSPC